MNSEVLKIIKPDDWHVHLRDGLIMQSVLIDTALHFGKALVMPNLDPPIDSVDAAINYQNEILEAKKLIKKTKKYEFIPESLKKNIELFHPCMTLYLTENLSLEEIKKLSMESNILAIKFYPAGATTNSEHGIKNFFNSLEKFELMSELGIVLCVHGEVVDSEVDVFDREAVFIDKYMLPLIERVPDLKIVFEHISTARGVDFVLSQDEKVAATITPQHLLFNRNDLLAGGIRPHRYCAPILKTEIDRKKLVSAATSSNNTKFFLGTDSAPHFQGSKESSCGCAGCFSAPHALSLYAEVFETEKKLANFEMFASLNGARFYNFEPNKEKITLKKQKWKPTENINVDNKKIIPLANGRELNWTVE